MMDLLASLNLVRRTRSVPNTITVIGVRKALLIGQPVYIFTHYLSRNSIGLDLIISNNYLGKKVRNFARNEQLFCLQVCCPKLKIVKTTRMFQWKRQRTFKIVQQEIVRGICQVRTC